MQVHIVLGLLAFMVWHNQGRFRAIHPMSHFQGCFLKIEVSGSVTFKFLFTKHASHAMHIELGESERERERDHFCILDTVMIGLIQSQV